MTANGTWSAALKARQAELKAIVNARRRRYIEARRARLKAESDPEIPPRVSTRRKRTLPVTVVAADEVPIKLRRDQETIVNESKVDVVDKDKDKDDDSGSNVEGIEFVNDDDLSSGSCVEGIEFVDDCDLHLYVK